MTVDESRCRLLSDKPVGAGPIVYWMDRDRRLSDNWALLRAQELAIEHGRELHIVFVLPDHFGDSTWRQHWFMLEGLKEVEIGCHAKNIRFTLLAGDPAKELWQYCQKYHVAGVVVDFSPLKTPRKWRDSFARHALYCLEVDAHNVVPCWVASPKQEFAAYTIRPKIHRLLDRYLVDFPVLKKHPFPAHTAKNNWKAVEKTLDVDRSVQPVLDFIPGEKAALKQLKIFVEKYISQYADLRNDPNESVLSDLSPYIHFGHISTQRIALEVDARAEHYADVFLEELIVRRELAENFCFYNERYDLFEGFPDWAKKTLNVHRSDVREYVYSKTQFDAAKTHDDLWNAAQRQLIQTGKMHGFMRMYWAKKILEWTKTPEDALKIGLYLNDRYSLDGCDPNGYVGVAWSVGGVHDRAWFERDVFGKIRYMNFNGCKRKFDVQRYIDQWGS